MFSSVRVVVVSVSDIAVEVTSVLISSWRCVSAVCTWWSTALLSVDTCWLTASVLVLTLEASPPASPPRLTMPRLMPALPPA